MKDFWQQQFNKILLVMLIIVFLVVAIMARLPDNYAVHALDMLLGVLARDITGKYVAAKAATNQQSLDEQSTETKEKL